MRAWPAALAAILVSLLTLAAGAAPAASAADESTITGIGATWSTDAVQQWKAVLAGESGLTVNFSGEGATAGRRAFIAGNVDFAISELPFQENPEDGSAPEVPARRYVYVPVMAGGLGFMYHLVIEGERITDLRLSGEVVAKIFAGEIVNWNDPAIQADNPAHPMPDRPITPIVRADSSATSARFTSWMTAQHPDVWTQGVRSQFPLPAHGKALRGSGAVAGYVSQSYGQDAIAYVETSYAMEAGFPVAKLLNAAGYYVAPSAQAVSIALLAATAVGGEQVLDGVYANPDPRAYPLSAYASLIAPAETGGIFTTQKGATLGELIAHAVCSGQAPASGMGYAPLPLNLVREAAARVADIPGAAAVDLDACANPTFEPGDTEAANRLLRDAPMPPASDRRRDDAGGLGVFVTVSGRFELHGPAGPVDFGALRRGQMSDVQQFGGFTVVDDRAELPGWTVMINVADFAPVDGGDARIPRSAVGYVPQGGALPSGVEVGPPQDAGSSVYPSLIALGLADSSTDEAGAPFDLGLTLRMPHDTPGGEYRSTVTLTLLSR